MSVKQRLAGCISGTSTTGKPEELKKYYKLHDVKRFESNPIAGLQEIYNEDTISDFDVGYILGRLDYSPKSHENVLRIFSIEDDYYPALGYAYLYEQITDPIHLEYQNCRDSDLFYVLTLWGTSIVKNGLKYYLVYGDGESSYGRPICTANEVEIREIIKKLPSDFQYVEHNYFKFRAD